MAFFHSRIFRLISWTLLVVLLVLAYMLSLRVTRPDFVKLVTAAPKARQILTQFMTPDLFTREAITSTVTLTYPIPCGSAPEGTAGVAGSARLVADPPCADVRETFILRGEGLEPNSAVRIAWQLPAGRKLTFERTTTDANGTFEEEILARPIAASQEGVPSQIEAEISVPGGSLRPSQALKDVTNAMFVTIFMALLATTFGTIIAVPLSFLAAANITRRGPLGTLVYTISRSILNLVRSYEPLVMATIFALIVGFGSPFAGVLALVFVTTASLGKMFSEAVESIDPGPIEALTSTGANRVQTVLYAVVPQIIPDFLSFIIYHWDINVRISTIIGFVGGGGIGYYLSQRINTFEYQKAGTALLAIILVVWVLDFLSAEIRKDLA